MRCATRLSLILLVVAAGLLCGCKVDRSAKPGSDDTPEVKDFEKAEGFEGDAYRSLGRDTEKEQPGGQEEEN
ncbi:MAG: hypothetical protein GWP05_00625 [Anaerolineaceae bacterium]|nr:hypothetical protein [Anaerolineaceae bacterium]